MTTSARNAAPTSPRRRARAGAAVLAAVIFSMGLAESLHLVLADHHAMDHCHAPSTAAHALQAPHDHGCGDHHTLADHAAREVVRLDHKHAPGPGVLPAAVALAAPAARGAADAPAAYPPVHDRRAFDDPIRGPPSLHVS